MSQEHSDFYLRYMQSEEWKQKREQKLREGGHRCYFAGKNCNGHLEVHHLRYSTLGHETMNDLLVLCQSHHRLEDRKRELIGATPYSEDWDTMTRMERSFEWLDRYQRGDISLHECDEMLKVTSPFLQHDKMVMETNIKRDEWLLAALPRTIAYLRGLLRQIRSTGLRFWDA